MYGKKGISGLIERFADLPDARVACRTDHDLLDIVVLALCAVMSGAEGWDDIEDWGRERETWLRRYLLLRNGIPGHDTIRRVFETVKSRLFISAILNSKSDVAKGRRKQSASCILLKNKVGLSASALWSRSGIARG